MTNPTNSQMRLLADYDRAAKRFSNPRDIYDFLLLDRLERIATALERLGNCTSDRGHFSVTGNIDPYRD